MDGLICDADEAAGEVCCGDAPGEPGNPVDSEIQTYVSISSSMRAYGI